MACDINLLVDDITALLTYEEIAQFVPLDTIQVFRMGMFLLEKYYEVIYKDDDSKSDYLLEDTIIYVLDSLIEYQKDDHLLMSLSNSLKSCLNIC